MLNTNSLKIAYSFCFLMLILSCKNNHDAVIGSWSYGFFMYSTNITILPNGEFEHSSIGCTGKDYSKGTWVLENDVLTLNSYLEYKTKKDDFLDKIKDSVIKNYDYSTLEKNDVWFIPDYFAHLPDSIRYRRPINYTYLVNDKYAIAKDSLIPIDSLGTRYPKSAYLRSSED